MISQQQQSQGKPRREVALRGYLKMEKNFGVEYAIIGEMTEVVVSGRYEQLNEDFLKLYCLFSKEIRSTLAYRQLNYCIWNDEKIGLEIRQKTHFFNLISDWIQSFELKVNDLKTIASKFSFVTDFFAAHAQSIFDQIVLMDQIHEDLLELLGAAFWGDQTPPTQPEQHHKALSMKSATRQQSEELLKLLSTLICPYLLHHDKQVYLLNCEMYLLRSKSQHYIDFILRAIEYILDVNGAGKDPALCLEKHQEMELTRLALIFLQRGDIDSSHCIRVIKLLMLRTSKLVRLAMVVDFVRYYDFLERTKQDEILEELQNMVYFRELVIGRAQIDEAGLITGTVATPLKTLHIPARSKQRLLITHESAFGTYSVLQIEVLIPNGDISLLFFFVKDGKQTQYWKEEKSEDRRVDIILKQQGIYILEFNNVYSWLKPKQVQYKLEQYCVGSL